MASANVTIPLPKSGCGNGAEKNGKKVNQNNWNGAYPTHFFAQVRMVMKFRNQLDNGGAANYTTTHYAGTRASDKAEPNRHVWLRLKP